MKNFVITMLLSMLTFCNINAQKVELEENPPNWPLMLSNLNQNEIEAGFLYNKTAMYTNLYDFNRGFYNLSHSDHFKQAINELFYASDETKFTSNDRLKTIISATPSGFIDIGIVNTTITILNFDEKSPASGGLTFPIDKFESIGDRPAFVTRKIFLASPLKELTSGRGVTYKFSAPLIFNNATTELKNLVVYFDDSTPVTVIDNRVLLITSKNVTYSYSGKKALKFVATFTDDSSITTVGYHYFVYNDANSTTTNFVSPCPTNLRDREDYKSTIAFNGYDEPVGYFGKFDKTIFYHQKNTDGSPNSTEKKVIKPIIIIDGFDPGDNRKTTDCDCEMDLSEGGCYEKNKNKDGTFNPVNHESIEDNMLYDVPNPITGILEQKNLITTLRELGYDVIILNIPNYLTSAEGSTIENKKIDGGADYVERNGLTLASYLKTLKSKLIENGSSEDIVIMGPSMGGLISRYALAYMEKQYALETDPAKKLLWKHNTRLWVSFDSPHLGANIPIGIQANIWFLGNKLYNVSAKDKFDNQLNSIAGKQMIILQFSNTLSTMSNNVGNSNNSPFFVQFQNNLVTNGVTGSNGFPVSIPGTFRKIAIINGSLSGSKNGVESGEFLNIRGYKDISITEGAIAGAGFGAFFGWAGVGFGAVIGGIFGSTNANATVLRCKDNFYPATGQTEYIFKGDGQNFNVGWQNWYINHKWYKLKGVNNDIRGSFDITPGGTFNTSKILREEIVKGLKDAELSSEIRGANLDTHSFIPTFSALAYKQQNQSWSIPLNFNLSCVSDMKTPFDSYFGAVNNTPHISLTKEMVNWLLKELDNIPQAPSFPLSANDLSGASTVCSTATYSFGDICKVPGNATWTKSSNLQITSSNGFSVNVSKTTYGYGEGYIKATFENGISVTKNVWAGVPVFNNLTPIGNQSGYSPNAPSYYYGEGNEGCNQVSLKANFDSPSILEYQWEKITTDVTWSVNSSSGNISLFPQCNKYFSFRVRARNICGWSNWKELEWDMNRCTIDCTTPPTNGVVGNNFILSPNPVTNNNMLDIAIRRTSPWFYPPATIDPNTGLPIPPPLTIKKVNISIYGSSMNLLQSYTNKTVPTQLDISTLPQGSYWVIFEHQGAFENYTILKGL